MKKLLFQIKGPLMVLAVLCELALLEINGAHYATRVEYIEFIRRDANGNNPRIVTTDKAQNVFGQDAPASARYALTPQQFAAFVPEPDSGGTKWTTYYYTKQMSVGDPVEIRYLKGGLTGFSYKSEVVK